MTHVLVTAPFPERLLDKIRSVSSEIEVEQFPLPDRKWPEDKTTQAEVYYAISGLPGPEQAPNLRWVQTHWAGVNHVRDHPIWDSDIVITTASGVHATNMAQYVMAQILAWANRVPRWLHYQRAGEWPEKRWEKFLPDELRGKTLGIAGYGSIGREVARLARAFGMTVLATKRDAKRLEDEDYAMANVGDPGGQLAARIYPGEATRSMVAECDYVVITLPLTERTHHLFDEEIFRAMKPTAFLVNVGRGPIIKEEDLVRALKKGYIAGAGLDVFETEPLPKDSPLWKMENMIISPHISGFTSQYDERATDLFVDNLRRYLNGEPLVNVVDREEEY
ncbi:MAG TPA: D-2-hydroxyacid dehydrogenase [Candidatus Sulfomarinibacteraceae bacterium]|nr:D-2-hydroxyacid dehydrogenase [Candidatus Sulfomarinibacteraceae bacterium]